MTGDTTQKARGPADKAMADKEGKVCMCGVGDYKAEVNVAICICRH